MYSLKRLFVISLLLCAVVFQVVALPVFAQDPGESAIIPELDEISNNPSSPSPPGSIGAQYDDILQQGIIFAGICTTSDPCPCREQGDCTLDDILQVFVNISVFILGISGSVVLLVFIYGGFTWLLSQGNSDMVERGKQSLIGAAVGLIIIFGAYTAITVLIAVLRTGEVPGEGTSLEDVSSD